jgi:hypothetical protein
MEAERTSESETSVNFNETTRHYILEGNHNNHVSNNFHEETVMFDDHILMECVNKCLVCWPNHSQYEI